MTATINKIRKNLIVFERSFKEVIELFQKDDRDIENNNKLFYTEKQNILKAKKIKVDLINYDLCGGFLYNNRAKFPKNTETIKNVLKYQVGKEFLLIVTFNLRDTGSKDYKLFIEDTINKLETNQSNKDILKDYFVKNKENAFSKQVENLRFCLPIFLNKEAKDHFTTKCLGQWKYCSGKTNLYQMIMKFTPKMGSSLGSVWPDYKEIKSLIMSPLNEVSDDGTIVKTSHNIVLS